jgi:hypothetical protein
MGTLVNLSITTIVPEPSTAVLLAFEERKAEATMGSGGRWR